MQNIAHFLKQRSHKCPNQVAVIIPKTGLKKTYKEIEDDSNILASIFKEKGIKKNALTLIMVKPGYELITVTFALVKVGAIPVIIDPGMGITNYLKCIKSIKPEALVGIKIAHFLSWLFFRYFKSIKSRFIVKKGFGRKLYNHSDKVEIDDAKKDDLAALVFTSGSTGSPKGVCYTHDIFNKQIEYLKNHFAIKEGEIDFPMLPIFSLFNPALGLTTVVPDINPSKPATSKPERLVKDINHNNITNSFGSPILWTKIADYCESNNIKLPTLKRILMAGCSVPLSLFQRYKEIAPNAEVISPYGATEALPITSIATSDVEKISNKENLGNGTCVGKSLKGIEIKIIEATNSQIKSLKDIKELSAYEIGEIIAKGPIVTQSYYNLPIETQASKIYDNGVYWHRMGDLGYLDKEGALWFCGRKAERVVTESGTLYTDCCEGIINNHPKVEKSALIALKSKNKCTPAIVIQPKQWPNSKSKRKDIINEILKFTKQYEITKGIEVVKLHRKLPVDIRHNAKIHRLKLAKQLSK